MTTEQSRVFTFPLKLANEGQQVIITELVGNGRSIRRLAELGLTPETRFSVVRRIRGQPIIISVRGSNLAIDRATADQIHVCLAGNSGKFPCDRPDKRRGWKRHFRHRKRRCDRC